MAPGQVVVAFAQPKAWLPWVSEAGALLAPAEAARVQSFRSAALREARTIAYSLHRMLLGALSGQEPAGIPLVRDQRGCPHVLGDIVHTSLSHTEGGIAIAVSSAGPVGVDLEPMARATMMPGIAARVCHPSEAAALACLAGPDYETALLALWVRKESLLKAAGIGLALEMDRFPATQGISRHDDRPLQARTIDAGRQWMAALATAPDAAVSTAWLHPDLEQAG